MKQKTNVMPPLPPMTPATAATATATTATTATATPQDSPPRIVTPPNVPNFGGRPKGTDKLAIRAKAKRLEDAITSVTEKFITIKDDLKKVPNGTLKGLIADATVTFELTPDQIIKEDTVRTRVKRGKNIDGKFKSPLVAVEPTLVMFCKLANDSGISLDQSSFIKLVNSLIKGSQVEEDMIAYKKKIKVDPSTYGKGFAVGMGYYRAFLKRHSHILKSTRAYRKDIHRSQWGNLENMTLMYDAMYARFVEVGIAEKLEVPVSMDRLGNIVDAEHQYGKAVEHRFLYPERVIHMDETGCNTNMKNDGQVGGKHFIGGIGMKLDTPASTNDVRFTLLPMSNAKGEALLTTVIYQSDNPKGIPANWKTGIDISAEFEEQDNLESFTANLEANFGRVGSLMPCGPVCHHNGVEIPCFVTSSPHGGITSQILADMLQALDELNIFPSGKGLPDPFIILDGHSSRFELPFLEYINNDKHHWWASIGVPYGTHLWQVGDSSELNGCFKT